MNTPEDPQPRVKSSVAFVYRLHRWFFAGSVVLGAAAACVNVATNPGYHSAQTGQAALLAGFAHASPGMVRVNLISGVITTYLLPVCLLVMAWLAMRGAPWLATIGAFLVLLGILPLPVLGPAMGALAYDVARMGSNPMLVTLVLRFNDDAVMSFYNVVAIPGLVLGPTLLGIALWRSRAIPIWAAALITFSRLLVFLTPLFPSLPGVDVQLPSWILFFIGSLPVARSALESVSPMSQSTVAIQPKPLAPA